MEDWTFYDWILKLLFCIVGVVFFGLSSGLLSFNVKKFLNRFRKRTPTEVEIERRSEEIDGLQRELAAISPVNEFAAYFKRKRVVDKLTDELNALSLKYQQKAMISSVKEMVVIRLLCAIFSIVCAFYSYDLVLFYVNESYLWPFNFILAFPFTLLATGSRNNEVPVTLFSYLCMTLAARRIYERRKINAAKKYA
uniref:Guided entry of tail-anchored proteins factor 1 n=1 Tax=Acrobeloides nanus TaxID=290746 RepID=A0A914DYQ5_9BILA